MTRPLLSGRRAAALLAVGVMLGACGVPTGDSSFSLIPEDEVLLGLNVTSTSTSTTTTTTTTIPDNPIESTTTAAPVLTAPVPIFFVSRGRLAPELRDMSLGASVEQIADVLEEGPQVGSGLESFIPVGLIVSTEVSGGVLAVDLDPLRFDRILITRQTEATAQIVLTMTSVGGIGQVTFTLGGEPIAVKKGNGQLSEIGEPVSRDDYTSLIAGQTTITPLDTTPTSDPDLPADTVTGTSTG